MPTPCPTRLRYSTLTLALAMAGVTLPAHAAGKTPTLAQLQAQLAAQQQQFQQQLNALQTNYEQRLRQLEQQLGQSPAMASATIATRTTASPGTDTTLPTTPALSPAVKLAIADSVQDAVREALPPSPPAASNAFNPEISLILDSKFARTSRDPASYGIRGFLPSGGEIAPPNRSFSLGESELAISANIDHYFRGNGRFSLAEEDGKGVVEVEEANIETLALSNGFKVKAGRFLSGVGYLNAQHPHEWDFTDAPLVYKAMFGARLQNDGVQVRWLAPTPFYLELGGEIAKGSAQQSGERNKNGTGLGSVFAHVGGDFNPSTAWQGGLSWVNTRAENRSVDASDSQDNPTTNTFNGTSRTLIADFVLKWAPDGNSRERYLKLQGEYFKRQDSGELTCSGSTLCNDLSDSYQAAPSGWYVQSVYQFRPMWRVGLRHDRLNPGSVQVGNSLSTGALGWLDNSYRPQRNTAMIDYSPSEFSRIRLQFARDESRGPGLVDNQIFLQYIMSMGAHGAHKF